MAKSPDDRDLNQRTLGFLGFSAFVHMGLLIVVLLAPSIKTLKGTENGKQAGIELQGEQIADASPAPAAAAKSNEPTEVLLADANDASAVALPAAAAPAAEPAPKAVEPTPPKIVKAAKVETADISKALKAARVEAAKTKAPVKAAKIETAEESPVEAPAELDPPQAEEVATQAPSSDDAVPLEVALPEKEALTQEQAAALQAPNAIPQDATPIETVSSTTSAPTTGLVVTKPTATTQTVNANRVGGMTSNAGRVGGVTAPTQTAGAGGAGAANIKGASSGAPTGFGIPAGAQVRDARTLIATDKPAATYPLQDRISRHEGTTVLLGHVTNDGKVERVTLERSSGSRMMDQSAAQAFSKWKFKAGQEGYIRLPIQFQLAGNEKIIPAELKRQ